VEWNIQIAGIVRRIDNQELSLTSFPQGDPRSFTISMTRSRSILPFYRRPEASLAKGNQLLTVNVKRLFEIPTDASAHATWFFDPNVGLPLTSDDNLIQGTMRYAIATSIKATVSFISLSPIMFSASHAPLEQRPHPRGPHSLSGRGPVLRPLAATIRLSLA
jgi:hypothetical protein